MSLTFQDRVVGYGSEAVRRWEGLALPTQVYAAATLPLLVLALAEPMRKGWSWRRLYQLLTNILGGIVWMIAIEYLSTNAHKGAAWALALFIPFIALSIVLMRIFFDVDLTNIVGASDDITIRCSKD
jgi:hypothetical protein